MPNHYEIRVTIFPVKIDINTWNSNDDLYYSVTYENDTSPTSLIIDSNSGLATRNICDESSSDYAYSTATGFYSPSGTGIKTITHTGNSDIIVRIYL